MKVITFPHNPKNSHKHRSRLKTAPKSFPHHHHDQSETYPFLEDATQDILMDITEKTLFAIAKDIKRNSANKTELRKQLIFVLDKLAGISEDLKGASTDVKSS